MEVKSGLPSNLTYQAVDIFSESFKDKFVYILGDGTYSTDVYKLLLSSDNIFYVEENGVLLGLLIFMKETSKSTITFKKLIKIMGYIKGFATRIKLSPMNHIPEKSDLYIHFIAVAPNMRGQGIGSKLIKEAIRTASDSKQKSVSLQVVNANGRAKNLYEKMGFKTIKSDNLYPINKLYKWDFNAIETMKLYL